MNVTRLDFSGRRQLPLIRQSEAAECGLACLAMVAGYFGLQTDLVALRQRFSLSLQGATLRSLISYAERLNLSARPVKATLDQVDKLQLPAILHWNLSHFVVLKSVSRGRFVIYDPGCGKRVYSKEELSDQFTGVALEFRATESFKKRDERTRTRISDLWGNIEGLGKGLAQVLILSIVLQVFILASPFYLQTAIDEALANFDANLLLILAIGFAGLTAINVIAQALRGFVLLHLGSHLNLQISGNLFRHLLRLPVDFFEKRHIGDLISRFGSLEPLQKMLTEGLIGVVIDGWMAATTLILMFVYSPLLASIALSALSLYLMLRLAVYRQLRNAQEEAIITHAIENTTFIETVRGITSVKLFGAETDRESIWQNKLVASLNANARKARLDIWFQVANSGIIGIETVVLVYVAVKSVMAGGLTVGMIFAFMAYKTSFSDKAIALVEKVIELRMLGLHLERVGDIAHAELEVTQIGLFGKSLRGSLELQNIRYRYGDNLPDILKGANLKISAGETVAIIGTSGCGKTTLLKIMTGLFALEEGLVLVDGLPLTQYGLRQFREQIGVVMQEDDLFTGSIADNISFFDRKADMDQIIWAATVAQIHDEITFMPMGYESFIGDMGTALSGGQKQRLMLARALYRNPKILFMDEGTAHLDIQTERAVNESLAGLGITRILIAHRPETIRMADRVIELREGNLHNIGAENLASVCNA